ncbi:MAG: response regulator [Campylobacterota bacterium]|nr:response regulator [Campylobacterota bacterium]
MINHKEFAKKMADYSILYVEDDLEVRVYLEEFLKRYFKNLYTCKSAEEALTIYEENNPDILLLDISLPGKSGIEFAEFVRL